MDNTNYLGRGWAFPIQFNIAEGAPVMLSNEADIANSLQVLLATRVGERLMQPGFGCNLDTLLFEAINESLNTYIKDLVFMAIYNYEPRITPDNVTLNHTDTEGLIQVEIEYTVKSTNSRHNLVYPFYLNEGTLVNKGIT